MICKNCPHCSVKYEVCIHPLKVENYDEFTNFENFTDVQSLLKLNYQPDWCPLTNKREMGYTTRIKKKASKYGTFI